MMTQSFTLRSVLAGLAGLAVLFSTGCSGTAPTQAENPTTPLQATAETEALRARLRQELAEVSQGLRFRTNSAALAPAAKDKLAQIARTMAAVGDVKLQVAGHADATGSVATNDELSMRRAAAVEQALIDAGAPVARVQPQAYGEAMPVASNETATGRAQNRRVELRLQAE